MRFKRIDTTFRNQRCPCRLNKLCFRLPRVIQLLNFDVYVLVYIKSTRINYTVRQLDSIRPEAIAAVIIGRALIFWRNGWVINYFDLVKYPRIGRHEQRLLRPLKR